MPSQWFCVEFSWTKKWDLPIINQQNGKQLSMYGGPMIAHGGRENVQTGNWKDRLRMARWRNECDGQWRTGKRVRGGRRTDKQKKNWRSTERMSTLKCTSRLSPPTGNQSAVTADSITNWYWINLFAWNEDVSTYKNWNECVNLIFYS